MKGLDAIFAATCTSDNEVGEQLELIIWNLGEGKAQIKIRHIDFPNQGEMGVTLSHLQAAGLYRALNTVIHHTP
jgi:hypothetical protein